MASDFGGGVIQICAARFFIRMKCGTNEVSSEVSLYVPLEDSSCERYCRRGVYISVAHEWAALQEYSKANQIGKYVLPDIIQQRR